MLKSQPVYFYTTIYLPEVVVVSYRQPVHTTSALLNAYTDGGGHDDRDDDDDDTGGDDGGDDGEKSEIVHTIFALCNSHTGASSHDVTDDEGIMLSMRRRLGVRSREG